MSSVQDELQRVALELLKDELKEGLARFAQTPGGKCVREVGNVILKAKREGRPVSGDELKDLVAKLPGILSDEPQAGEKK